MILLFLAPHLGNANTPLGRTLDQLFRVSLTLSLLGLLALALYAVIHSVVTDNAWETVVPLEHQHG